ncbi:Lrp/AsnC family transcriptional regulator [Gordonia sp. CPCC 205515]|uniref:Lrp/AsnC family transcriptional regulator n=1 Tax=Gordonia sp. CPCC 205515 TaxID=3140791 RepID=UPI003AF37232
MTDTNDLVSTKTNGREIDTLDHALVERLRIDGREGSRSLAKALGVNEVTISNRIRRLEQSSMMRVVAVVSPQAVGRNELCIALIRVKGRAAVDVAAEIAALPEALGVNVTSGSYDLIVFFIAKDHQHLGEVFTGSLLEVEGVDESRGDLVLEVLKFDAMWASLDGDFAPMTADDFAQAETLDVTDVEIIRLLQDNARQSNRKIAAELGVSEGTVRSRIKRMQDERIIRIQAISDVSAFGVAAAALIGIRVDAHLTDDVAKHLLTLDPLAVVVRTFGEYHLMVMAHAADHDALVDVILNQISPIPGVRRAEAFEIWRVFNHRYLWSYII